MFSRLQLNFLRRKTWTFDVHCAVTIYSNVSHLTSARQKRRKDVTFNVCVPYGSLILMLHFFCFTQTTDLRFFKKTYRRRLIVAAAELERGYGRRGRLESNDRNVTWILHDWRIFHPTDILSDRF